MNFELNVLFSLAIQRLRWAKTTEPPPLTVRIDGTTIMFNSTFHSKFQ